jgi:hypothetical protein
MILRCVTSSRKKEMRERPDVDHFLFGPAFVLAIQEVQLQAVTFKSNKEHGERRQC